MNSNKITKTWNDLPTGGKWLASRRAHQNLWALWRAIAPVAAARNEGIKTAAKKGYAVLETFGAPLYEGIKMTVTVEGDVEWCSEQCAPDFHVDLDALESE